MLANPATPIFVIGASPLPASITSAYPSFINLNASPILLLPVAHAVTIDVHGPLAPYFIAMLPAPRFMIVIGTKNGETLLDFPIAIFSVSLSIVIKPPIPDPTYTPNLLLLILSISNPDDFMASSAAYSTNCENLSNLLTSFFGITSSG